MSAVSAPHDRQVISAPAAGTAGHPRRWAALAVVLAGAFMTLIDTTIVTVAIPTIQVGIHAAYAQALWFISGYALTYGLLLIAGGRLGDLYGHKRLFLVAIAGFTVVSVICGLAQTGSELIAARVLQGAMAGLMYPQVTATIQLLFKGRERGQAYALLGATIGLATVIGPLAGGLLIAANIGGEGWRLIFLVNLPAGIATVLAAVRVLPATRPAGGRIDLPGLSLASAALFAVTFALIEARPSHWAWWIWALLGSAGVLLVSFGRCERSRTRRGQDVVLDPQLLAHRQFSIGSLIALVFFAGFSSLFFTLSLYLQQGLGLTPIAAGAASVPFAVGAFLGAGSSDALARSLGHRVIPLGAGLVLIGLLGVLAVTRLTGTGLHALELAPPLLVGGLGCGFVIAPLTEIALAGVPWQQAGAAAGAINTAQRLGTAIGTALVGVVLFSALGSGAVSASGSVAQPLTRTLRAQGLDKRDASAVVSRFSDCFAARARASDPTATPRGCVNYAALAPSPIARAVNAAATSAVRRNFTAAFQVATVFNVVTVALTLALGFVLPARRRRTNVSPTPGTAS